MRKTQRSPSLTLRVRIPRKRIREKFHLTYELKGCQKAVDFLTEYYGVRRMRIILNGRTVGNGDRACYFENKAYFTKRGLNRRTVLHEFYHFLVDSKDLDIPERNEEINANHYVSEFLKR